MNKTTSTLANIVASILIVGVMLLGMAYPQEKVIGMHVSNFILNPLGFLAWIVTMFTMTRCVFIALTSKKWLAKMFFLFPLGGLIWLIWAVIT